MTARYMNEPLSRFTSRVIGTYLKFPEKDPITALDVKCFNGEVLKEITKRASESHLYGIEPNNYAASQAAPSFVRVARANYKSSAKITNDAFSLAVVNPVINNRFMDDVFHDYDPFQIPDFAKEERQRLTSVEATQDQLDLSKEGFTEAELTMMQQELEKKITKAAQDREIKFRRAIREQERRMEMYRDDKYLLSFTTKYLAPHGILIFITPKEFIDGQISFKLANNYTDIQIYRLDDEEYEEQRKCIIFAKKKVKSTREERLPYELMQFKYKKYKEIPVLELQASPVYELPTHSKEEIATFRVGPITIDEANDIIGKSPVIDNYIKKFDLNLANEIPQPPTQLHKGHVSLLLASGLLNGFIGTGPDQHLVKGSVIKMSSTTTEEEETVDGTNTKEVEREYFHVGIKYLDRYGNFHKLL